VTTRRGPGATPLRSADLTRYLLERERLVTEVRWHPVSLLRPTVVLLVALSLIGYVAGGLPEDSSLEPMLPWFVAALVCWYGWVYLSWRRERLVVTDRRLLLISGLISRRVAVMPLRKVTDMTYEQPLVGRLFDAYGWGTFVFESAGQDQAFHRIPFLPHPDVLYRQLTEEIFGDNGIFGRKPLPAPGAKPAPDRRDDED
jgi:hypothetical protein